ncbi:hypothetical protein J6524_04960 [Bradyrhizobium sp. WSM 1738]|uniref:helix-turn-helix domain-containing protein n=1 Tax=Bradyrhizobium hereditatis TaxID=2821405 RepID=UPI0035DA01AA|nr:hypothetical protein [Bradyrhizobium hereditatis]
MTAAVARQPTKTELEAHQRRSAFRQSIAEKAAALKEKREGAAPEAVAAQPDPPADVVALQAPALALPMMKKPWFSIVDVRAAVPIRVSEIQDVVCNAYGIDLVQICADRRTKQLVRARQVAMYLAKVMTGRSLPEIGRRFGGRDHTTVLHAVRKITAKVEFSAEDPSSFDPELSDFVKALRAEIEARRGE